MIVLEMLWCMYDYGPSLWLLRMNSGLNNLDVITLTLGVLNRAPRVTSLSCRSDYRFKSFERRKFLGR